MNYLLKAIIISVAVEVAVSQAILLTKPYTLELVVTMPVTGNIYPMGPIALEPIKMIAEIVNNRSDILPDYNVVIDVLDDQCDAAASLSRTVGPFFLSETRVFNETKRIGQYRYPEAVEFLHETATSFLLPPVFAGPVCSSACMVLGNLMPSFNTVHVTFIHLYRFIHI